MGEGKCAANSEFVFARVLRLSGAQASFLWFVSCSFPGLETPFEIIEFGQSEVIHLVAGLCAAYPGTAMHQVSLALLELGHFLSKIRRVDVVVDRSRNVSC